MMHRTLTSDHANHFKPNDHTNMIEEISEQEEKKNVSLNSTDIEHIHLAQHIILHMLTRINFKKNNKRNKTNNYRKNDNNI